MPEISLATVRNQIYIIKYRSDADTDRHLVVSELDSVYLHCMAGGPRVDALCPVIFDSIGNMPCHL